MRCGADKDQEEEEAKMTRRGCQERGLEREREGDLRFLAKPSSRAAQQQ